MSEDAPSSRAALSQAHTADFSALLAEANAALLGPTKAEPASAAAPAAPAAPADPAPLSTTASKTAANGLDDLTEGMARFKMSQPSQSLVDVGRELLGMRSSAAATEIPRLPPLPVLKSRSNSPEPGNYSGVSSRLSLRSSVPNFKRIDFDDRLSEAADERKPAWKALQDSVNDSYGRAKRYADKTKDDADFLERTVVRPRTQRGESPYGYLDSEFTPRRSYLAGGITARSNSLSRVTTPGSGPYAAPTVDRTQGVEGRYVSPYEQRANDVEARLLKSSCLPAHMKTITAREFRAAPAPAAGSASDQDDYDFSAYTPRPYYSRPNRDDPDYFDFDLQHSVDMYKRPEGKYTPRGPQDWETKLLTESRGKGSAPISGYMFTKGESDWRGTNSSYLSAALRTPKFWEKRFESIGAGVRESNPISLDSINRNKPVPSRWTEYRDPDFEDYVDPRNEEL